MICISRRSNSEWFVKADEEESYIVMEYTIANSTIAANSGIKDSVEISNYSHIDVEQTHPESPRDKTYAYS